MISDRGKTLAYPKFFAVALTLCTTGMAAIAGPDVAAPGKDPAGWVAEQAPGFYRLQVGDFKVTVLSDGAASRDVSKIMSKPVEVRAAFFAAHIKLPVDLSINCFLIDTGGKRILIDTGAGELFSKAAGSLIGNMRAAGYRPEDIDAILLTHIHADHSGGLSVNGKRLFENATVYVDKRDPAYWLDTAEELKVAPERRASFQQARLTVNPYVEAGKLSMFDGATELFPGVRTIPEYGHTPGLTGYLVESNGERLLLWGDIVHAAEAQFRDPSITIDYDVNRIQAVDARRRILDVAAKEGYLIGGAHLSFPGLGYVQADRDGYAWMPAPYHAKP